MYGRRARVYIIPPASISLRLPAFMRRTFLFHPSLPRGEIERERKERTKPFLAACSLENQIYSSKVNLLLASILSHSVHTVGHWAFTFLYIPLDKRGFSKKVLKYFTFGADKQQSFGIFISRFWSMVYLAKIKHCSHRGQRWWFMPRP